MNCFHSVICTLFFCFKRFIICHSRTLLFGIYTWSDIYVAIFLVLKYDTRFYVIYSWRPFKWQCAIPEKILISDILPLHFVFAMIFLLMLSGLYDLFFCFLWFVSGPEKFNHLTEWLFLYRLCLPFYCTGIVFKDKSIICWCVSRSIDPKIISYNSKWWQYNKKTCCDVLVTKSPRMKLQNLLHKEQYLMLSIS